MIAQPATPGMSIIDTATVLTAELCASLKAAGVDGVIRRISRETPQPWGYLSASEASLILGAGMALGAYQAVRLPGWLPSAGLGTLDGQNAAANALSVGLPLGISLWMDLEGVKQGSTDAIIAHCVGWYEAVKGAGFDPGLYVGFNTWLDAKQLYDLPFNRYWKSASTVPVPLPRGFCMQQGKQETLCGIQVDRDVVSEDAEGGLPVMAWREFP